MSYWWLLILIPFFVLVWAIWDERDPRVTASTVTWLAPPAGYAWFLMPPTPERDNVTWQVTLVPWEAHVAARGNAYAHQILTPTQASVTSACKIVLGKFHESEAQL